MRQNLMMCLMLTTSVALSACDDALDNPAEGAASVKLNNAATGICNGVSAGSDAIPDDNDVSRFSSATSEEAVAELPRVVEGNAGQDIQCTVRQTAEGAYTVSANLSADNRGFSINGDVAAGSGTGLAVTWVSPLLSASMQSSACTATVDQQRMGGGAIRLSYDCPNLVDLAQPDSPCAASGSIVLERCDE